MEGVGLREGGADVSGRLSFWKMLMRGEKTLSIVYRKKGRGQKEKVKRRAVKS